MKTLKSILFSLSAFLLFTLSLHSQQWRVFTTSNSILPTNITGTITIDTNNVKWIGTFYGMVKIDGNSWTLYDSSNTPFSTSNLYPRDIDNQNNIWITAPSSGIAKFNGINWTIYDTTNSGLPNNSNSNIAIDMNNIKWIGIPGLIKFDDTNWTWFNSTNSGLPNNTVKAIAIENNIKWLGTFALTGGLVKYNDTNWIIYNTGNSGLPSNIIEDIRIDAWGNKWICTYAGGIAKFNSIANNWIVYNMSNSGLPANYPQCVTFKNHIKYIGTLDGGFAIFNDTNWVVYNSGNSPMLSNDVQDIEVDKFGNIWLATSNGLIIYNSKMILGVNSDLTSISKNFKLLQNYPNPFNPVTKIKFDIAESGFTKLIVHDILGKEIDVLVNENLHAGTYETEFDGSNLAGGIYFVTLFAGTMKFTKKMILIK